MNNLSDCMYDHRYERPLAIVIDACTECGKDIYEGEEYYTFGVINVCEECINDYVRQAKKEGI